MRKIYTFCLMSLALLVAQNIFGQERSTRMVLLEQFTNVSCAPCASANPGIVTLHNTNASKMALIYYHVNWPSSTDPMYTANSSEIDSRISAYGVDDVGVPYSVVDGVYYEDELDQTKINNNAAVAAPFEIRMIHSVESGVITVQTTVKKTATTSGTLTARIAVIEEEMSYTTAPGTNKEKVFHNVFKQFLPDQNGTTLSAMSIGDSVTITKSWTYSKVQNANNLRAVGFVQNTSSKAVQQAAMSTAGVITDVKEDNNSVSYNLYPNPSSGKFTLNINTLKNENVTVNILDINGKMVSSEVMNINGGVTKDFDISKYSKGLYFVRIVPSSKVYNDKIIVE